jgi:hypothetical protein
LLSESAQTALVGELRGLIEAARSRVAQTINAELVMLHWQISDWIGREVLQEDRANYGEQVVEVLSAVLTIEYGRGFSRKSLLQMIRPAQMFSDVEIVSTSENIILVPFS